MNDIVKPSRVEVLPFNIPDPLKRRKQCLLWRYELNEQGKWTKVPYHAKYTQRKARSNDPTTWSSFEQAMEGYENTPDIDGIGFVPSPEDDIVGIDLDHCIDDGGNIAPWALEIVKLLDSYTEITPSGHGLRIFIRGKKPSDKCKKGDIEVYEAHHYLSVTGHHLPSTPATIEERQAQLNAFMEEHFSDKKDDDTPAEVHDVGKSFLTDEQIIEKLFTEKNKEKFKRVWDGDITDYKSPSEARAALLLKLAFYSNRDPEVMDRLFRQSGIYDDKWDSRRGQDTYGQKEIMTAISKCRETYTQKETEGIDEGKKKESQADILMKLAEEHVQAWFTDQYRDAHASFHVGDHNEVWPILGRDFKDWLSGLYYMATGKGCSPDAMRTALSTCSARARFGGSGEHELNVRVAEHDDAVWYDLADHGWRSIKVTADGWEVITEAPILFRRLLNTGPQVEPVRGGDPDDVFKIINIRDERTRLLFKAWLLAALMPNIPHPVMVLYGPQGSAKTSAFRTMKAVLDPGIKKTDTAPRTPPDLVKLLNNQWLSGFDNLSGLPAWMSDAFCRAVTGDGYSERQLYTNNDEFVLTFKRPIALNGINVVATRPDLLDRCILIGLERIDDAERISEAEVEDRMRLLLPGILGGLLDLLVKVLGVRMKIVEKAYLLPRMADFALFGCAMAEALGIGADTFLDIYRENLGLQHQEVINGSTIAKTLIEFMDGRDEWIGSPGDLLNNFKKIGEEKFGLDPKSQVWPKADHVLTKKLNILKTNLAAVGIAIEQKHTETARLLRIAKTTVRSVSAVRAASGKGLQHDATISSASGASGASVRMNSKRQASVSPNVKISLKNDGTDSTDGIYPPLLCVGDEVIL
ncbi:MAG TPA: hypothetical protein PLU81_16015 [Deltaproteobacteria bacterium]|nr:hypothetical protein [Deltaproteobacteria bacterium]